jgi:diguanylate cyclase (GGDEF)-like protein/PAS domain S-box-containing protein
VSALAVFEGPGGRELLDALIFAGYLIAAGYALVLLVAYHAWRKRRAAEAQVRLAAAAFESSIQGMMITDAAGAILQVNAAFERLTGYGRAEALGRNPAFLASGRHDPDFFKRVIRTVEERGTWEGEMWTARKDAATFPVFMTLSAVRNDAGRTLNYAFSFVDISERKTAEQRIRHLAYHDLLTDLPNRSLLRERFEDAAARARRDARRVALLFVDLDRFKNVNDALGHAAGDELLRHCAARLLATLRTADVVGRQGGDEFAVLLADLAEVEDAARIAAKLVETVRRPFLVGSRELHLTCSIGVAVHPENGADFETLLRNSDAAMYAAKEAGRDCYRFHSAEMTRRATWRLELENDLRRALRSDELWLAYQPQVALADGALTGAEALARWRHPTRENVSPGLFMPVAEDSGIIVPLGEWVLREACRARARWLAGGLAAPRVSVNVSAVQFREPGYVASVERALADSGLPARLLELEVTESVIMGGFEHVVATLEALGRLGVRIAVDDFGTGYSSLSYLKRLPVDKLKIDRSFVTELPEDADGRAIAQAIVGLAHGLGMRAIAEGVENERQAGFLRGCGCEEGQGYLYAAPLSAAEFEARYVR